MRPEPVALPEALRTETPTTKLLYLWLEPRGEVGYTVRELAERLFLSTGSVQTALTRLRGLGLLEDIKPALGSAPGRYQIKR